MEDQIIQILELVKTLTIQNQEMKTQLQGLVEVNARFAQEIIAIKNNNQNNNQNNTISNGFGGGVEITTTPTPKKSNKVVLTINDDLLVISGNTYAHRSIFGENGASWNGTDKVWNAASDKLDSIVEELTDKGIEYELI